MRNVATAPLTVHTLGVVEVSATANPELAVAATVRGVPTSWAAGGVKVMVWATGAGCTVSAIAVDAVRDPEVPETVTVAGPDTAVLDAVSVRTCVPGAVPAAIAAVTPMGKPLVLRLGVPAKPPWLVCEMVTGTFVPACRFRIELEGARV